MNSPAAAQPVAPETGQNEKFPPQIAFIVGNEACERFSFYGMTSILTLYLRNQMLHNLPSQEAAAARATEIVHLFNMAIYFLPLIGGWLADRWWGRYRTILFISLFYCLGHGTLALFGGTLNGVYAGLAFIAIGAGGIKPSVAAFVGDQFGGRQGKWLTRVYGWFYWAVNFGALFAFTMIPALRDRAGYRWAFGVPGIFMGLATLVFWLGTKYYVRVPPGHKQKEPGFSGDPLARHDQLVARQRQEFLFSRFRNVSARRRSPARRPCCAFSLCSPPSRCFGRFTFRSTPPGSFRLTTWFPPPFWVSSRWTPSACNPPGRCW